jgi:hypothetical protein
MAVQVILKYEPLFNADFERDHLKLAMQCCMVTPNVHLARHRSDGGAICALQSQAAGS